jgi:hypothetical protein
MIGDIDGILDLEIIPVNKLNPSMQVGPGTNASNNGPTTNLANNNNTTASSEMSGSTIKATTS